VASSGKLPGGDEKWSVAFMYLRVRVKRVIGLKSEGLNRTRVVEWVAQKKADIREGINPLPKGGKTQLRFAELGRWYLDELEASGGKNMRRKRLQLERRLIPALGMIVVENMAEEQVGKYANTLLDEGLPPATINRDLATLSHVLSTATRRRMLRQKPCVVQKLSEPEGRTVVLTAIESEALVNAARRDSNPHLWLFVEFGLSTAMRAAEIVSARFDLIDWEHRRLFLPNAKAGARSQPLTKSLVNVLHAERETRVDRNGWVFPSTRSSTGHATDFNAAFGRAVVAAGLSYKKITPHVMRHTAATNLVSSGAPLPAVQRVTGHKTLVMLMRYVHLADRNVDDAISALDRQTGKRQTA
jgi:integrase